MMRKNFSFLALLGLLTVAQPLQVAAQDVSTANAKAPAVTVAESFGVLTAEEAERERLNKEQLSSHLAENEASRAAHEQAVRDRDATIARQQAEHQAAVAALEAERLRLEQEHEAAMARWRADVEACNKGDRSRCAQP